ncbi:MAG: hypothetical protein DMF64_20065 [Acidobacteria bacterium]|nr:MAG: hypothetical protein DMF64_20065 [Acidobacteriota bacterium]
MTTCAHIGCQGWNYDDWVTPPAALAPVFYPHGTRAADMLGTYARAFETVEVDSTFYAVPAASTIDLWAQRTPQDFIFSLKLPQAITHEAGLRAGGDEILNEFCTTARRLGERLGAVLVQLPPQFEATTETVAALKRFLPRLPRDLRFAVEFRHGSWAANEIAELLAQHNVAVALVEGQWLARRALWQMVAAAAPQFAYVRWMGARDLTRFDVEQRPRDENLALWREAITRLCARVSTVYAYFSNYYEGHAPASANKLKRLLSQRVVMPAELADQPSLF